MIYFLHIHADAPFWFLQEKKLLYGAQIIHRMLRQNGLGSLSKKEGASMNVKAMEEEKSHHKMPFAIIAGIAIIIWILTGCASGSTSQPVQSHGTPAGTVQVQTPHDQLMAWKNGPGGQAFEKVAKEWPDSVTNMTPVQMSQMIKDIHAAKAHPVPASIDPGGYYADALMHLEKGMIALQNASPFNAIFQMQAGVESVKHFTAEVKAIS